MRAKNLANIHQCDRYEARYWLAEARVSTTMSAATDLACDFIVETNSALGVTWDLLLIVSLRQHIKQYFHMADACL
jgi:hypothetical protein